MKGKQFIMRTTSYLSILNAGMLLFLFLSKLKELNYIQVDLDKYIIVIFVTGLFLLLIIGWIDVKFLKAMQEEATISFNLTPPLKEMKERVDDLWETMKKEEIKKNEK